MPIRIGSKPINVLLIGATITVVVLQPFASTFDRVGTIAFLSLAMLEHINYFEVQLMYDNKNDLQYLRDFKRLKKAKLKVLMTGSERRHGTAEARGLRHRPPIG